jgi:tripartite ATP-independent transporter DctM subunit
VGRLEELLATAALVAMAALPIAEGLLRWLFGVGIPGVGPFVQHLTLWVGFLGAALAAREEKLLALGTTQLLPERWRRRAALLSSTVAAAVSALLARASLDLVLIERRGGVEIAAGVPVWVGQLVMPAGLALIALRLVWRASAGWRGRLVALAGLLAGLWLARHPLSIEGMPAWPWIALLVASTALGGPIFATLGGAAALLFLLDGVPAAAVPVATYELSVSPMLPAIPLFTLAGFLLAEGDASRRLLRVFRALVGWLPGGTAVVCAAVCAFFTTFTGGSGVTILALGVLLYEALRRDGYAERFSLGLLTGAGSLGLLFPPALPLILYGIVAAQPIEDLFVGGLLPGVLLVALVAAWGVREGLRSGVGRRPFDRREALAAVWAAKWELALPVVVLVSMLSGFATPVEAAALAAVYALVAQLVVHREVAVGADLLRVLRECVVLVGGVLLILGMAKGLTSWMVDALIPTRALEWVQSFIDSQLVFLLCLNLFLLLVGCLMDIFSAIVVVVPLIVPLGAAYGVDPVHLGILFIANLELGYLTPPVGLNLFLASYRFDKPLLEVWRAALPPLAILAVGVLLITYLPVLTTGLVGWWSGS